MKHVEAFIRIDRDDWLILERPVRLLEAQRAEDVASVLDAVENLTLTGRRYAAGYVAYEAGAAFGLRVNGHGNGGGDLPLVAFAIFEADSVWRGRLPGLGGSFEVGPMRPSVDQAEFTQVFEGIKKHLAVGNSYQVNYTFRVEGAFRGEPRSLFAHLVAAQEGRYSAYLRYGDLVICSASPELFFTRSGAKLSARPMKGTARRGKTLVEDRFRRDALKASEKERAENVMIVDMVRNDLGRIADVGSVEVPELFTVERYPNVWQMTSTVTARSSVSLGALFGALHPCASVTGAPKIRTMEILAGLEGRPRGIYTGAVGFVQPGGDALFNVAIRTALVDERNGRVEFGVGSGIVWDSDPEQEYAECLLKGSILAAQPPPFELLETMRWTPGGGFLLLDRHLSRLRDSAEYFDFAYRADLLQARLQEAVTAAVGPLRVRMLMAPDGTVRVESQSLQTGTKPVRVAIAAAPIDRQDVFLYHKTTHREVYAQALLTGVDDVILWNADRHVTEASTANVVVEIEGVRVTPPVEEGLLAGTFRAELLAHGEVREGVVTVEDLRRASGVWLINSVQEWRPATIDFRVS